MMITRIKRLIQSMVNRNKEDKPFEDSHGRLCVATNVHSNEVDNIKIISEIHSNPVIRDKKILR
jgi:hypothetical protein